MKRQKSTNMRKLWLRLYGGLLGCLLISQLTVGCYLDADLTRINPFDKEFKTETDCRENDDCSKVGYCLKGKCVQCRTGTDCQEGLACVNSKCQACKKTSECGDSQACISGACKPCKSSLDCGGGSFCRTGKCIPCISEKAGTCLLTGTITENLVLSADITWILRGIVFVGDDINPITLTIEPGTVIKGELKTTGALVVRRNAKLKAEGTKEKPIVFTSDQPKGSRNRGDWGGIVINGRATTNRCAQSSTTVCESFGEGGTGWFGGSDDNDSSGSMKYVRIEFAGKLISPENELNGLALQGVGSGTTLEYIQVHMGKDDGIEFFGGTANIRHVLITGSADDSLDWTYGWRGRAQFVIIQQYDDDSDNGIEADNSDLDSTLKPRSQPTLSNFTIIGSPKSDKSDLGILLRAGTGARIYNSIVMGFNDACLSIDGPETFKHSADAQGKPTGTLVVSNNYMSCAKITKEPKTAGSYTVADFYKTMNTGNQSKDPLLTAPLNLSAPNFAPKSGSPVLSGAKILQEGFFNKVKYIGAMEPGKDWTKGWTTYVRK